MERFRGWLRKPLPRIRFWMSVTFGCIVLLYSTVYLWWAVWFFEKFPEPKKPSFVCAVPVVEAGLFGFRNFFEEPNCPPEIHSGVEQNNTPKRNAHPEPDSRQWFSQPPSESLHIASL